MKISMNVFIISYVIMRPITRMKALAFSFFFYIHQKCKTRQKQIDPKHSHDIVGEPGTVEVGTLRDPILKSLSLSLSKFQNQKSATSLIFENPRSQFSLLPYLTHFLSKSLPTKLKLHLFSFSFI